MNLLMNHLLIAIMTTASVSIMDPSVSWEQSELTTEVEEPMLAPGGRGICYFSYGCKGASPTGALLVDDKTCRKNGGRSLEIGGVCWSL